ncbi:hypothetical protein [Streptomyces sp. PvR034]|uniref:hypothetical protein n=1 Tax=Streptomyces sp. PvR034 TaxID=3156401 RepID=UPI0033976623
MTGEGPEGMRRELRMAVGDPEFSVRVATFEDLERLTREALLRRWAAAWSSVEALAGQVPTGSTAFLCPLFRNGGAGNEPASYRCHLWFVERSTDRGAVSLIDVGVDSYEALREVTEPALLRKVIRYVLDSHPASRLH